MKFNPEELRARFRTVQMEIAQMRALAAPHRSAYENKRNELMQRERDELDPLKAKMKEVEEPLYDLQQELAALSRALGGKTGG